MALRDLFVVTPGTKRVLLVVVLITAAIIGSAWVYYRTENRSIDPRVINATIMHKQFRELVKTNELDKALTLLDDIEKAYTAVPGYERSYEVGVINNDRGAVFLNKVETEYLTAGENVIKENIDQYMVYARGAFEEAVKIYEQWLSEYGRLSSAQIETKLRPWFLESDPAFSGYDYQRIVKKRVAQIVEAQVETERRLSVTFTNLGMIARYNHDNLTSKDYYEKALELWADNHIAKNNLRVLHGQPIEKPGIVRQLFPKERIEEVKKNIE